MPEVAAHAAPLGEYLRTKPEASVHVLRPLAAAYAQVVWFIFANADVPDGYLRVPDAEFPAELDERP